MAHSPFLVVENGWKSGTFFPTDIDIIGYPLVEQLIDRNIVFCRCETGGVDIMFLGNTIVAYFYYRFFIVITVADDT